jgi:hypothetical protein
MMAAGLGILLVGLALAPGADAAEKQYVTTTIHGTLANPSSGEPIVGATVRFTPTTPDLPTVEAVTDSRGQFVAEGLGFGMYAVVIQTVDGETIRGINQLPIRYEEVAEVEFTLSDRIRSSTSLYNQPERFLVVVDKQKRGMKRFWREFGIFLALAAGSGAGAF